MKTVLFTGAPLPRTLNYGEDALTADLLSCFASNGLCGHLQLQSSIPQWRSLPLQQIHLPTGLTQPSRTETAFDETSFLSVTDVPFVSSTGNEADSLISSNSVVDEDVLSQYYEHSFTVHEDIPTSQIIGPGSTQSSYDPGECSIDSSFDDPALSQYHPVIARLQSGHISDLKEAPNANYLHSISPQTMTVNLVVGIISVSQPHVIRPRRGGRAVELVEMALG